MSTATVLFSGSDFLFAEMELYPDDSEWGEENEITRPIVALPAIPVWQSHDRRAPTLMTPNSVVLHHPGSEYSRSRFQGRGYRCIFFFPSEALVREIATEADPSAPDAGGVRFPQHNAPIDARAFVLGRRLAADLAGDRVPPNRAREELYRVLRACVLAPYQHRAHPTAARGVTARAHTEVVEAAKDLIARGLADRLPLDEIAAELYVSPYHLARVFRARTGYSVHAYQVHLRLREGFDRLERGRARDVSRVAADLGFSSHGHFSAAFRATLGGRPSEVEARKFPTA
jgi:AraC family transcriptional regulator